MLTASARFNSLESGLDSIKASNSSIKRTIHYYLSFSHIIPDCYIWDGASYHHSKEFREYLEKLNQGKTEEEWLIRCIRLAPNAPEQNPIEDVWLQGKEMLRKYWNICQNFRIVKWLFEWTISQEKFFFQKLKMYGSFL